MSAFAYTKHMKTSLIALILFLLLNFSSFAQNGTKDYVVGKSIQIHSEIMNDERHFQVYLPDGYGESDKTYDVLYILDGQRYFLHGVSLQKSFTTFMQTPEFIVVGIPRKQSDRNSIYTSNFDKYLSFIEKEILSYIDKNFRSSRKRLLYGWAFGGGFVFESMVTKPDLFDAYIAASPFPVKNKISKIDSLFANNNTFNKLLYFSAESNEGAVKESTDELYALLQAKYQERPNWIFKELLSEEHRSTPFTTLYHGISQYYCYYPELQFNSLEEFSQAGGIEYVYDYYKKRSLDYGFPNQLSDWTMFSIVRNAIRANAFEQFDKLLNEFSKSGFIERLRISRAIEIARYYLDNKNFEKAIELFNLLNEIHPNSERPLKGLGDTYQAMNKNKKASIYYEKAKKLSQN